MPFSRSSTSHTQPFTPIWANDKWKHLVQGNDLLQCLDMNGARRFGDWISGARAAKKDKRRDSSSATNAAIETFIGQGGSTSRKRAIQSISGNSVYGNSRDRATTPTTGNSSVPIPGESSTSTLPQAPEGFWETEMPPYEDKSIHSDPMSSSDDATGIGSVDDDHPGPHTMIIKLVRPGKVTLEMTKSTMPIYHIPKSGGKTKVTTHTFAVITTIPRSALITDSGPAPTSGQPPDIPQIYEPIETDQDQADALQQVPRKTILPNPSSPMRKINRDLPRAASISDLVPPDNDLTPQDVTMATVPPFQSRRPLIFNRDGTVSRQQSSFPAGATDGGLSLDVHELLQTTDWSKTGLGPRDQWPQSLKSAGQCSARLFI